MIIKSKHVVLGALIGLAVATSARADMMPVGQVGADHIEAQQVLPKASYSHADLLSLDQVCVESLPEAIVDLEQRGESQIGQSLANGPGSLSLCLWALAGLGLCRSAPIAKRASLACLPEWYHDGGIFQIGHSHTATPESLCSAWDYCFIQAIPTEGDIMPKYRLVGAIVAQRRVSQRQLLANTSRGPPHPSSINRVFC